MGRPLPGPEPADRHAATRGRPGGAEQTRVDRERLSEASAAADASLRSLSNLLLAAQSRRAADRLGPNALPLMAPTTLPSAPQATMAVAASGGEFHPLRPPPPLVLRARLADWSPSSPPPLAPASDSGSDWEDMPPLLSSPPGRGSQLPSLDDMCPWGLLDDDMQDSPLLRPRNQVFASSFLHSTSRPFARAGGSGSSQGAQPAAAAARPLDAELSGMAGRLAELARAHRGSTNPALLAGLRDAANLLAGLSREIATGPPELA